MPSPEELINDLNAFLDGVAKGPANVDTVALTRVAISLIQTFPATRGAVMEYFGSVFDSSLEKYVEQIESGDSGGAADDHQDAMIADIQHVLGDFLQATPQAWAPIISTWSLELLGELSSRYAGRGRVSATAGLNETLQLWMSCLSTRTLIDITTQCLSCLMSFDTESCISALLDMSVAHSPHFDWVVAHVGSCFPHTVITRVLSCGLRDFSAHPAAERAAASSAKLGSVVGILGHLAAGHFADIRAALLDLFKASLVGDEATVPYLLQLASLSPTLLRALTSDVMQTLTPAMLPRLSVQAPAWCEYFGGAYELEALLVRLALGCQQGGEQIVRLLLDSASPSEDKAAADEKMETGDNEVDSWGSLDDRKDSGRNAFRFTPEKEDSKPVGSDGTGLTLEKEDSKPAGSYDIGLALKDSKPVGSDEPGFTPGKEASKSVGSDETVKESTRAGCDETVKAEAGPAGSDEATVKAESGGDEVAMATDEVAMATGPEIQLWSKEILEMLLQEIDQTLRSSSTADVPLLACLGREVAALQPLLLSHDQLRMHSAARLVGLLGYHSPAVLISCSAYMLLHSTTEDHLAALARLVTRRIVPPTAVTQDRSHKSHCLTQALEQAIRSVANPALNHFGRRIRPERLWTNLAILLKWEREGSAVPLRGLPASNALCANVRDASALLSSRARPTLAHAAAQALDLVAVARLSTQLTLKLMRSTVDYFFLCVEEQDDMVRLSGVNVACRLLSRIAQYKKAARAQALTELTQRALFGAEALHFGALVKGQALPAKEVRLTDQLHKMGAGGMLSHRVSSTALTGSMVRPRHTTADNPLTTETVRHNTQLLVDAIKACATETTGEGEQVISLDAVTNLSLAMVQLISSDVMYNGLPWPDEEFCKVTVERDLHIRRTFTEQPLAWRLLRLVAAHRPCLCYASVLLRALTATLLAQWGAAGRHSRAALLAATQDLLEVMAVGQLLPPPLSSIRDVIPFLKPLEIMHLLRACVWNYMRDNVPSPALFARDSTGRMWRDLSLPDATPGRQYTEPLRYVMQANIARLGTFYAQMFVRPAGQ